MGHDGAGVQQATMCISPTDMEMGTHRNCWLETGAGYLILIATFPSVNNDTPCGYTRLNNSNCCFFRSSSSLLGVPLSRPFLFFVERLTRRMREVFQAPTASSQSPLKGPAFARAIFNSKTMSKYGSINSPVSPELTIQM